MSAGSLRIYVVKRLLERLAVAAIIITLTFFLPRFMPGTPMGYLIEDPRVPLDIRKEIMSKFGLDRPLHEQFIRFLDRFLLHGDLGYSFMYQRPVTEVILERLPWTIVLLGSGLAISIPVGIIVGVTSAWKRRKGSKSEAMLPLIFIFGRALPVFWIGMVLLYLFAYKIPFFPIGGAVTAGATHPSFIDLILDIIHHTTLPLVGICFVFTARYAIVTRNNALESATQDYVMTAIAKGLKERVVLYKHVLRPAMLPVMTMMAIDAGFIIGGAVLTETVFSYPGTGTLMYVAVINIDYPLILGSFTILSLTTIVLMFIIEIAYRYLDPRITW